MTRSFAEATAVTAASARFEIDAVKGEAMGIGEMWEFAVPERLRGQVLRSATLEFRKDPAHWHTPLPDYSPATWDPATRDPNPPRIALEGHDPETQSWRVWRNPDYRKTSKRAEVGKADYIEYDDFYDAVLSLGRIEPDRIRLINRGKGDPNHAVATVHALQLDFFPKIKNPRIVNKIYTPGTIFADLAANQLRPCFGGGSEHGGRYPGALVLGKGNQQRVERAASLPEPHAYSATLDPGAGMQLDSAGRLRVALQPGAVLGALELSVGDVDLTATQELNEDQHRGRKGAAQLDAYISRADGGRIPVVTGKNVSPAGIIDGVPEQDGYVIQPGDQLVVRSRRDCSHLMGMRMILSDPA